VLGSLSPPDERAEKMKAALDWEPDVILSNTVVNGLLLEELAELAQFRIPVVTHVHEMQQAIESWAPGRIMELTLKHTSHFIAVSAPVQDNLRNTHKVPGERMTLIHEFLDVRRLGHPEALTVTHPGGPKPRRVLWRTARFLAPSSWFARWRAAGPPRSGPPYTAVPACRSRSR
jgi:hypothetical protein